MERDHGQSGARVPKARRGRLLEPLKRPGGLSERVAAQLAAARDLAARLLAATPPAPTRDSLTADHPLSRAFGLERARDLIDPPPPLRVLEAAKRRSIVLELSLKRRPVREIASAAGLTYYSTIKVRARLREEGKL